MLETARVVCNSIVEYTEGSLFGEKWLRGHLNTLLYKQKVHLTVVKYVEKAAV